MGRADGFGVFGLPTSIKEDQGAHHQADAEDGDQRTDRLLYKLRRRWLGNRRLRAGQQDLPDAGDETDDEEVLDGGLQFPCRDVGDNRAQQLQHDDAEEEIAQVIQAALSKVMDAPCCQLKDEAPRAP